MSSYLWYKCSNHSLSEYWRVVHSSFRIQACFARNLHIFDSFFFFFFFFFLYVCFNISVAVTIHNERENNPIVPPCYYTTVYTYMHLILLKIKFVPRYTILNKLFKLQRKNNIILKIVILLWRFIGFFRKYVSYLNDKMIKDEVTFQWEN